MAKATGTQTTTEAGGAASAEVDLAAALQAAQLAVTTLAAEITALGVRLGEIIAMGARQRTEHAEELARLRVCCDEAVAERDRAVKTVNRAEAWVGRFRAHLEERIERDHAILNAVATGPDGSDAVGASRLCQAPRGRTSRRAMRPRDEAGSDALRAAATVQVASGTASGEEAEVQADDGMRLSTIEPPPERAPERPDPIEDAVMVTIPVPRWLFMSLERAVAAGSFPTVGAALLARCDVRRRAPAVCAFPQELGGAQNRTAPQSPAPDSG